MIAKLYALLRLRLNSMCRVLGSKHTEALGNFVRSIPECWLDPSVRRHVVDMHVIRHAGAEFYRFCSDLPPAFRTEMHFAKRHVYHLRDVLIHLCTGACTAGGNHFQESYGSLRRCLLEKPFPVSGDELLHLQGPATCIHTTGYYHFLLEEVPRLLWTIAHYPEVKVYIADGAPQYCLDLLGILLERGIIQRYETMKPILMAKVDEYLFTQAEAYSGFVHNADLSILIKSICREPSSVLKQNRKIYVSRINAARSFNNENDVEMLLQAHGFEVVHSENLTFSDQFALFKSAEMVIAGHGAGLANLIWSQPGTNVIEIFSTKHFNDCYARLCSSLQLKYKPMWARDSGGWGDIELSSLEEMIRNV